MSHITTLGDNIPSQNAMSDDVIYAVKNEIIQSLYHKLKRVNAK